MIRDGHYVRKVERQISVTRVEELNGCDVLPQRLRKIPGLLRNKDLPITYSEIFYDRKARHHTLKELQDAVQAFLWVSMDPCGEKIGPKPDDTLKTHALEVVAGDLVSSGLDTGVDIKKQKAREVVHQRSEPRRRRSASMLFSAP